MIADSAKMFLVATKLARMRRSVSSYILQCSALMASPMAPVDCDFSAAAQPSEAAYHGPFAESRLEDVEQYTWNLDVRSVLAGLVVGEDPMPRLGISAVPKAVPVGHLA
ncbi:hypothetical protein OQA88_4325 [Cercophora sp. LCS_1]